MVDELISQEELIKKRTPSELWSWIIQKVNQICSTPEGLQAFRLQKGCVKQLVEEVTPLAIFGMHMYADTEQVLLQPVIGNQPYDAIITDLRTNPASETHIEITQSHEGKDNYWRRRELLKNGYVPSYSPVIKTGTRKTRLISIPMEATSVEDRVKNELDRILTAAKGKAGKDYPANTSLIIFFDDAPPFEEVMDEEKFDSFIIDNILNLDLNFSTLYLIGHCKEFFREYNLAS